MSATIQLPQTLKVFKFGCMIGGLVYTVHRISAPNEEEARTLHDRDFPNHDFRFACPDVPKRRRRRVNQITPCVKTG